MYLFAIFHLSTARASKGIRYFYATRLYEAMKGKGTNDEVVIRTVVSRSEVCTTKRLYSMR